MDQTQVSIFHFIYLISVTSIYDIYNAHIHMPMNEHLQVDRRQCHRQDNSPLPPPPGLLPFLCNNCQANFSFHPVSVHTTVIGDPQEQIIKLSN